MTTTAFETFAAALATLRADAIPSSARKKLELHVIDAVGAWIAASRTPEGKALIAFRARLRPVDAGSSASLLADVATHCALARLSEIDDIHLASMTTPGSIVIPAGLLIARSLPDSDPSEFGAALVVGYEAMIRLGLAIGGP